MRKDGFGEHAIGTGRASAIYVGKFDDKVIDGLV